MTGGTSPENLKGWIKLPAGGIGFSYPWSARPIYSPYPTRERLFTNSLIVLC